MLSLPVLVFVTFIVSAVEGPNCPDRDYSKQLGSVRNQGASQWCHAFVAADLMGFAQGLRPPEQISALDVGIQQLTASGDRLKDPLQVGADPRSAALLKLAAIPAITKHQDSVLGKPVEDRSQALGTTASAMLAYISTPGFCVEARLPSESEGRDMKNYISSQLKRMVDPSRIDFNSNEPCQRLRNHPMNGVLKLTEKLNEAAMDTVASSADRACEPRRPHAPVKIALSTYNFRGSEQSPLDGIVALLGKGAPAGISFDVGFMYRGGASQDHAASVVASRWNGESCEFRIRNSSRDCSIFNPKYRERCDGGNVWVAGEDLRHRVRNVFGVLRP